MLVVKMSIDMAERIVQWGQALNVFKKSMETLHQFPLCLKGKMR